MPTTAHARLSAQIDATDRELSVLSTDQLEVECERAAAIERLEQARAKAEQPLLREIREIRERRRQADRAPDVIEALAEVVAIDRRLTEASRRDAAAMERRRALVAERAALPVALDDIRRHQEDMEQARSRADELQARLEEAQRRTPPERPDMEDMERRHARVLADLDLGTATPADLAAVEKERTSADRKTAKADTEAKSTARLVRGLSERLCEARALVADLERDHRTLVAGYARSEFLVAAREYRALATRTFSAHGRLTALASIGGPELSREHGTLLRFDASIKAADLIDNQAHRAEALAEVVKELQSAGVQVRAA